jgi:GntP family gluconate:H+ symporter
MNDAGFWLIGRTAGLTETETLKTSSAMISLMGFAGMIAVLILARLFPLA